MALVCHDQYDHPLLWCDERRRAEERRIANEGLAIVEQQRKQGESQKLREINELRQVIENHCPWGRPGGGAPNENIRRGNILHDELFPDISNDDCRKYIYQAPFRVPKRSSAIKLMKQRCSMMAEDKQRQKPHGSYAPWRQTGQVKQSFMKSMGWTDQTLLQTIDRNNSEHNHEPVQELDESPFKSNNKDTTNSEKPSNGIKLPSQCCAYCFCDCKAKYSSTKLGPQANKENAATIAENVASKLIKEGEMPPKCSKQRNCMITGGVELVPLLAKRRAMQRPISLSTTDVTKYPTERKWQDGGVQLLDDLCRQMSQKERRIQMGKDAEVESIRRHFQTLDTFWGRPGHGAPQHIKTKQNLNDLLYRTWT